MSLRIQPQACTTPKIRQEVKDSVCLIGRPQRSLASREPLLRSGSRGTMCRTGRTVPACSIRP